MINKLEINNKNIPINKFSKYLFIKDFFIDHQIKKILRLRDDIKTKQKWFSQGFKWSDVSNVFDIINQYCSWPNNLFWPEDELLYILRSYSSSLDGVSALMKLEEIYNIKFPDFNFANSNLILLISILQERRK